MKNITAIKKIFDNYDSVSLAYFFGSYATNDSGPSSDYDFAVYLKPLEKKEMMNAKMDLLGKLTSALKTDSVDLLVLNNSDKPELNYEVVTKGKLLKEVEPYKLIVEPNIFNEYFDFKMSLQRNGLTKAF